MKKETKSSDSNLRHKAEELLKKKKQKSAIELSETDKLKLIHELEVHQVELNIINEELMLANEQIAADADKFTELYDFSPSGYLTLSREGKIVEANLTASKMLGMERSLLVKTIFGFFVSAEAKQDWNVFLDKLFKGKTPETCELALTLKGKEPMHVLLNGHLNETYGKCMLTMVDVTSKRRAEEEIKKMAQMLDAAPCSITVHDLEGNFLYANKETFNLHGYISEEFFALPLGKLDTPESAAKIPSRMKEIIEKGEASFEVEHFRKDGTKFPLDVHALYTKWGEIDAIISVATDITESKKYIENIRKSEVTLQITFDNAPIAIAMVGTDRYFQKCNRSFIDFIGYSQSELEKMKIEDITFPEDVNLGRAEMGAIIAGNMETANFQKRYVRKNGDIKWGEINISLIKDEQGNPLYFLPAILDITDRIKAETELAEKHQFIESLVNLSPDVIYIYDILKRKNVYSNEGLRKILGYSSKEIMAMGTNLISELMHPDDFKIYLSDTYPKYESLKDGDTLSHEYRMKNKNGEWRWLDCHEIVYRRTDDGTPAQILGVIHDFTEKKIAADKLKISERSFRDLFDNMSEGVAIHKMVYDETGKAIDYIIENVNNSYERILGIKVADAIGKTASILYGTSGAQFLTTFARVAESGISEKFETEFEPMQKSFSISVSSMRKGYFSIVFEDITERRNAEEILKNHKQDLELALQSASMGVWRWDIINNKRTFDDQVCSLLGLNPKTFKGSSKEFFGVIHPDDRDTLKKMQAETINNNAPYHPEYRVLLPDNSIRFVSARGALRKDENGIPIRLDGTLWDSTEQKLAEVELRNSHTKLNFFNENSPLAIVEWDADFVIKKWTGTAEHIFGWRADEVVGKHLNDISLVYQEDIGKVDAVLNRLSEGKEVVVYSFNRNNTKDGRVIYCEWFNTVMTDFYGKMTSVFSRVIDVSQRMTAKMQLEESEASLLKQRNALADLAINQAVVSGEFESAKRVITEKAAETMYVARASIWLLSDDGEEMRCVDLFESATGKHSDGIVLSAKDYPAYFKALKENSQISANDARNNPHTIEFRDGYLIPLGITSMLDSSIQGTHGLLGIICFEHMGEQRQWKAQEEFFANAVAAICAKILALVEQNRTNKLLLENEAIFNSFIEHSPVYVFFKDENIRSIRLSRNYEKLLGKPLEELLGKNMEELFPSDFAKQMLADDIRILTAGKEENIEEEFNGRFYNTIKFPIRIDGKPKYLAGYTIDITEQKKKQDYIKAAADEWQKTFDASPDAIAIMDTTHTIKRINNAMVEIVGKKENEILNHQCWKVVHGTDFPHEHCPAQKMMSSGKREIYEYSENNKWYEVIADPVFSNQDKISGFVHLIRDVTARKEAEEILKMNEQRLALLFRLSEYESESVQEFLDYALNEIIKLSESKLGYIYYYDEEKQLFTLNSWSKEVMDACMIMEKKTIYKLEETGLWGEAVRQRQPIMVNDFQDHHPLKKGYPEGHAPLHNFLTVPVFDAGRIVAVVGVANKNSDYQAVDIQQLNTVIMTVWNMTETKKSLIELKHSEEKFSMAFRTSPYAITITDPVSGEIVEVNDGFCDITSYAVDEVIGKSTVDLWLWENDDDRKEVVSDLQKGVLVQNREYRFMAKSGKIVIGLYSAEFIKLNERILILSSINDITEKRKAEEKLREKDVEFRKLSSNVPDLIYQFTRKPDGTYCIPVASEGIRNIFACSPEDVVDSFEPIVNVLYPDDLERVVNEIEDSAKNLSFFSSDFRVQVPGKDIQWIAARSSAEKLPDGSVTWYGFAADITERKMFEKAIIESEKQYRTLFESSYDAIMTIEPPLWRFTSGNRATLSLFKAKDEDEFTSNEPWKLSPEKQPDGEDSSVKARLMIDTAMQNGSHSFEWKHKRLNGEEFLASVLLTRMEIKGKQFLQATVRDITEIKRAEEALLKKMDELQRFHNLTVDRELMMVKLKKEVNELLKTHGKDEKYKIVG